MKQFVKLTSASGAAIIALCCVLLTGCASTVAPKPPGFPATAKDWNGLDSVEFVKDFQLQNYSRVVVPPLDSSTTALPPKEENTYLPVVGVLRKSDDLFQRKMAAELKGAITVTGSAAEPTAAGTLVVRGVLADVHPGSQAARYWAGFGAGSAWVKITGEVADGQSGDVFFKFQQQRVGSMGMWGGSYDGLLSDCVEAIGEDVGRALRAFQAK